LQQLSVLPCGLFDWQPGIFARHAIVINNGWLFSGLANYLFFLQHGRGHQTWNGGRHAKQTGRDAKGMFTSQETPPQIYHRDFKSIFFTSIL
jgi:hypothetical protein